MDDFPEISPADTVPRRLHVYDGGFLIPRIRRILALAGWQVTTGRPGPQGWVGIWGHGPKAWRGEAVARRTGARILRVDYAFLRSIRSGRDGEPPVGLLLDGLGMHDDSSHPSELEECLSTHPLDDTALLDRARAAMNRMRRLEVSKYNAFDTDLEPPEPGYVLVVDQRAGDAGTRRSGAAPGRFREMLALAQIENPGQRILVSSHPDTGAGHRRSHFGPDDARGPVELLTAPHSPWKLLEGATAVYTISSQLGFEAILAGHCPRVFGQPFYAGWGLTADEDPPARRQRRLTRAQLFAAAMILRPTWYDPWRDRLCDLEDVLDGFEARLRAFREDRRGYVVTGMRLRQRGHIRRFFGSEGKLTFGLPPGGTVLTALGEGRPILGWAGQIDPQIAQGAAAVNVPLLRVEDGILRSPGPGAKPVPPMSLVRDDLGIHYDPANESRLERLIAAAPGLPDEALRRAERLQARLVRAALTKSDTGVATLPDLPAGHRILVPGQVEDAPSILRGCGEIRTNRALLEAARAANPDAVLIYIPHPDVEAGRRAGALPDSAELADLTLYDTDPAALIATVDEVWTLTSLIGFEALLRGRKVTCLGAPFYAGWGLTTDLGPVPERRRARPSLAGLIHAALIDYPRYLDPVTGLPCPVEVAVERLEAGISPRANPLLSRLQGLLASHTAFRR